MNEPLSPKILVSYVIDYPDRTEPIGNDDKEAWGVSASTLHDTAIANLQDISANIPIDVHDANDGPGRYAIVNQGDAYDAARILVPDVRRRLLDKLGSKVFGAVPNRDFLVAWSADYIHRADFIAQAAKDVATRPYPLSAEIFAIEVDSVRLVAGYK